MYSTRAVVREIGAHVVEQQVGVGLDRLVAELGERVVRAGDDVGHVAVRAADRLEDLLALHAPSGRRGCAEPGRETRRMYVTSLERSIVRELGLAGVGEDAGAHAHVVDGGLRRSGAATLTFSAFQPKRPSRESAGDRVLDVVRAARDAVAVAVLLIGAQQDGALVDRLEKARCRSPCGRCAPRTRGVAPDLVVTVMFGLCSVTAVPSAERDHLGVGARRRWPSLRQLQLIAQIAGVVELDGHRALGVERTRRELAGAVVDVAALAADVVLSGPALPACSVKTGLPCSLCAPVVKSV